MKKYGDVIYKLRKKSGLTQEQLGNKLNVTYQAVSKWEKNLSEPDLETIEKLVEIFEISISDFFNFANNPEKISEKEELIEEKNNNKKVDIEEVGKDVETINKANNQIKNNSNIFKSNPWYIVAILGIIIVVLSFCAIFLPIKYSSKEIYSKLDKSVFCITAQNSSTKKAGTGFFINKTGLAVTNYHVIKECTSGEIQLNNGKKYEIKEVVGCDEDKDIAIIQIDIKKSSPVVLGNSDKVFVGEKVYAIGYPESFNLGSANSTFTEGIISKTSYSIDGNSYIQSTVDITNGNSGGVLINEQAQVIGITTLGITNGSIDYMNMSIPINKVKDIKKNIKVSLKDYCNMHKIIYFYDNGIVIHNQKFLVGEGIKPFNDPKKDGYTFDGWYISEDFNVKFSFNTPNNDITKCYAKWIRNSYTICFDANEGNGSMNDIDTIYDTSILLPKNTFTKSHFKFSHWKQKDTDKTYSDNQLVKNLTVENNGVVVLIAIWEMEEYSISFDGNGSDGGQMNNLTYKYNQEFHLPENNFTKKGYIFDGWLYNGKIYKAYDMVSKLCETEDTITFITQWKPITYKIRFKYNGQMHYEQIVNYDEKTKLMPNTFTKDYYNFYRWYSYSLNQYFNNEEEILNLTFEENKIIEFTAQFSEYTYTIRYNKEKEIDVNNCVLKEYKYSQIANIESCKFNKPGYVFVHWIDDNGNIYEVNIENKIYMLSDKHNDIINFYAVWREISYNVYYSYNIDGVVSTKNELGVKTYEEEFILIEPEYLYDGYDFICWEVNNEEYKIGDIVSKLSTKENKNVYIYAIYQAKKYEIYFDGNGSDGGQMSSIMAEFGKVIILPENGFSKTGYLLKGWQFYDIIYTVNEIENLISEYTPKITLTAIWVKNLNGDGSIENPYTISTLQEVINFIDLSNIHKFENKLVILTNDIDCEFVKLDSTIFSGTFDGRGNKFLNVDYKKGTLFEENYGIIKNFGIENLNIKIENNDESKVTYIAGLVNVNFGFISKCFVKGDIDINTNGSIDIFGFLYESDKYKIDEYIYNEFINNGLHIENIQRQVEFCYTDLNININATSDIEYCYIRGFSGYDGKFTDYNYSVLNLKSSLKKVNHLIIEPYSLNSNNAFSIAKIDVEVEDVKKHNLSQKVKYLSDNSEIKIKINGSYVENYIVKSVSLSDLQSENWQYENLFNVCGIWKYEEGKNPTLYYESQTKIIETKEDFLKLNNKILFGNYILNCDIDLNEIEFVILENHGVFDGNGHIISNLYITGNNTDYMYGLFKINYGTIKNLGLANLNLYIDLYRDSIISGLCAMNIGDINGCFVKGKVFINYIHLGVFGGISGILLGRVSNCYVDLNIKSSTIEFSITCGIVGVGHINSTIFNCYSLGDLETESTSYGIAYGDFMVQNSFTKLNIVANNYAEIGFISQNYNKSFSILGQYIKNYEEDKVYQENARSLNSISSKIFLTNLNYNEFVDVNNLQENEEAVWIFNEGNLPTLWFDK